MKTILLSEDGVTLSVLSDDGVHTSYILESNNPSRSVEGYLTESGQLEVILPNYYCIVDKPNFLFPRIDSKSVICTMCNENPGELTFKPIMTFETHMEIKFINHIDFTGECEVVPVCRKCAINYINESMKHADDKDLTFWA
jgi:hypothetical protein